MLYNLYKEEVQKRTLIRRDDITIQINKDVINDDIKKFKPIILSLNNQMVTDFIFIQHLYLWKLIFFTVKSFYKKYESLKLDLFIILNPFL